MIAKSGLLVFLVTFIPWTTLFGQGLEVLPDQGVSFFQVDFGRDSVLYPDTRTGQISVHFDSLQQALGIGSDDTGFINVVTLAGWVVQNIPILPWPLTIEDTSFHYITTMVDLGFDGDFEDITELSALVWYTDEPQDNMDGQTPSGQYPVSAHAVARCGYGDPQPTDTVAAPPLIGAVQFLLGVPIFKMARQAGHVNVQTAHQQCAPAAVANSLDWLKRTQGVAVPDPHVPGLGRVAPPFPPGSLVGEPDFFMARWFLNPFLGAGVAPVNILQGKLDYLDAKGIWGLNVTHLAGPGLGLPAGVVWSVPRNIFSVNPGGPPTAAFIYKEIKHDEDVELCYAGPFPHCVVVRTAGYILGIPFIIHHSDELQTPFDWFDILGCGTLQFGFLVDVIPKNGLLNLIGGPGDPDVDFVVTESKPIPNIARANIQTPCLTLSVGSDGSMGDYYSPQVSVDYYDYGDCDTTADLYLGTGSPIVAYIDGNDTVVNYSIFNERPTDDNGFIPIGPHSSYNDGKFDVFSTGKFVTHDSTIALEKTWYAHQDPDTCNSVIQCIKVYSNDGASHNDIMIGEAIDWNIPSDSGADNSSGFDDVNNTIWQYGGEYNQDDSTECQDNDTRFGALCFLGMYHKIDDSTYTDLGWPFGAYTASNADYVYPYAGFDPQHLWGKLHDSTSGYSNFFSAHPDSQLVDLHTVMCYLRYFDLGAEDTIVIYISLITVQSGDEATFFEYRAQDSALWCKYIFDCACPDTGCCNGDGNRGNVDDRTGPGGEIDVSDLSYLVDYLFKGGPAPPCREEGNVDGLVGPGGPIDVADLSYLVDHLFKGGPPPPPCPEPC